MEISLKKRRRTQSQHFLELHMQAVFKIAEFPSAQHGHRRGRVVEAEEEAEYKENLHSMM